jgi:hypothetical protein
VSVYDEQRAEFARTPQAIATLGVRYCANHYAQVYKQLCLYTDEFIEPIGWTRPGGTTVTSDTHESPGPTVDFFGDTVTADTLAFAAANDYVGTNSLGETVTAASHAFTGSVWARTVSGTGTLSLRIQNTTDAENVETVVNVTETWTRFSLHKLFTGGAAGEPRFFVYRRAGDLASVVLWRANLTENPGNVDAVFLWPSVWRYGQIGTLEIQLQASRCEAADRGDGARCFYTMPTCQDRANFNAGNTYEATPALRGIREYRFCRKDAPLPLAGEDIRPYITGLDWASQEIDPEKSITKPERVGLRMDDDNGPGLWDPVKSTDGALVNTQLEQGSFWRRFMAIHRFYANPECYAIVQRGFVADGMTEALYLQRGKYLIANMEIGSDGTVTVQCADRLKLLTQKGPAKISTTNVLAAAITSAGATTIFVEDASEFTEPPADGAFAITILIGTEKMNVTGRDLDLNTLTVTRGRWGTTATTHLIDAAITEVIEFGTERSNPSLTPMGKNLIDCVIEAERRGGIPEEDIDVAGLEAQRDIWWPSTVDTATGETSGTLLRRTVTDPTNWETLITELREIGLLDMFVGEDQRVTGSMFAPALPTVTLATLTDDENFLADSVSVDDNNESRVTRVAVAFDLINGEKGDEVGHYLAGQVRVEPELEAREGGGEKRLKLILSKWIQPGDTATASKAAAHVLGRYRNGVRRLKATVELKDDDKKCGDSVLVTTRHLQTPTGATDSGRQMRITKKTLNDDWTIELELVDAILPGRPAFIAPAGYPDYDSATSEQRRYAYIASGTSQTVGTAQDPPYTIW